MKRPFTFRAFPAVAALLAVSLHSSCVQAQNAPAAFVDTPDIGVGLEGLADWSRAMMFADAMKTSRAWGRVERPWEHEVKTDALGWPLEDAGVIVVADTPNIDGTYQLSFDGRADVRGHGRVQVENLQFDEATNRSSAQVVVPAGETQLFLSFTGTNGGVKNVKLMRPNSQQSDTFYRPFVEKLAPFSTLRFMDYLSTNNNSLQKWENRTTKAHASQANPRGGALEYAIELANLTDKDVWVNVPDQLDEDGTRAMAQILKNGLEAERRVYVEWSNEVWNWQFQQATRNLDAAKIEGREANSTLAFDRDQNEGYWAMRRIAKRSAEVGQIFREVFVDEAFNRVRPVYATQVGYEEVYKQGLMFLEHQYKQPNSVIYGLAGAPYFQVSEELNKNPNLTVDEIFAAIPADMDRNLEAAATLGTYARFYNLKHLAYEGGQHLQDHGDVGNSDSKIAANRDPRMGAMLETYLRRWNALGGDLFVYFTLSSGYSKWGSWGLVEDITKSSPKYEAVTRILNTPREPLVIGAAVPGEIEAGQFAASNRWDKKGAAQIDIEPEKWFHYAVRVSKAGTYRLTAQIAANENASAQVFVDSQAVATMRVQAGDAQTEGLAVPLSAGFHVIRIAGKNGRFALKSLAISGS